MVKKTTSNVAVLPEELLTEVLVRLPVKTIGVCKSVSKPWLSLISNPNFINSHLNYIINNNNNNNNNNKKPTVLDILDPSSVENVVPENVPVLPFDQGTFALPDLLYFMDFFSKNPSSRATGVLETLLDPEGQDMSGCGIHFYRVVIPRVFGSSRVVSTCCCNGIVCLNPLIRRCKGVRVPEFDVSSLSGLRIGFGYDSGVNDYKVFRTFYETNLDSVALKMQVYSVNGDSWREFRGLVWGKRLGEEKFEGSDFVVVKDVLYFSSWDEKQLVSFDLRKEVFGLIPFPRFVRKKWSDVLDFKGSVAVVFESVSGTDLWTLDDYVSGQGSSWTKMFSIAPSPGLNVWISGYLGAGTLNVWLSCYLGAGKFYGKELRNGNEFMSNVLYNCEKKVTRGYGPGVKNILATLKYTETLVSLDGFHQVEENAD